jgi:hypothetical protein
MGFSVTSPSRASSIMAEISLAQAQGPNEEEGLTLPQEFIDSEMPTDFSQQGCLRGEAKPYTFTPEQGPPLLQQLTTYLADVNRPQQQKTVDSKEGEHHLSFKESLVREKEFKVLEPHKQSLEEKQGEEKKIFSKTTETARRVLEKASIPKALGQSKEAFVLKQQHSQAQALEMKMQREFTAKTHVRQNSEAGRKMTEGHKHLRESERENASPLMRQADKNEEPEQKQQPLRKDEEEGFADGQRWGSQDESDERENQEGKIEKIEKTFAQEFASYAAEESILSQILKMRVTQFDVLVLFIEILKLEIRGREQEKLARMHERELQLLHMQKVVENYKSQSHWLMMSSLGSGILGIVSGFCPIIGHTKGGDWILDKLGGLISSLRSAKKDQFFEGIMKMTFAMSESMKNTGQIHQTFSEGNRTFDQHMSEMHRSDWEENTRTMEEIKDNWKGIENFLYQTLQMYHDAVRQLYSSHQ